MIENCKHCPLSGSCLGNTRPSVCENIAYEVSANDPRQRYWHDRVMGQSAKVIQQDVQSDFVLPQPIAIPANTVIVQGHANSFTGYGQHTAALAKEIEKAGVKVKWLAFDRDESFIPLDPWVSERIING